MTIEIVEVAPRDGLQNEPEQVATGEKVSLVGRAVAAGARRIEVTSFVSPKAVPQLADAEAVAAALPPRSDVTYIGLVLNRRGAERALACPAIGELGAVCVATDTFAARNQNQTSAQSLDEAIATVAMARDAGRSAQITIAAAFGCPFEGEVPLARVVEMARRAAQSGAREIALADTIGVAVPDEVARAVAEVARAIDPLPVRVHLHNTRNTGIANVLAAVRSGARTIDAAIGGIGGCPFAPGAAGNVATEDVLYLLERSGLATSWDMTATIAAAQWLGGILGRPLPGMNSRAPRFPRVG